MISLCSLRSEYHLPHAVESACIIPSSPSPHLAYLSAGNLYVVQLLPQPGSTTHSTGITQRLHPKLLLTPGDVACVVPQLVSPLSSEWGILVLQRDGLVLRLPLPSPSPEPPPPSLNGGEGHCRAAQVATLLREAGGGPIGRVGLEASLRHLMDGMQVL
jgi:hypothetical protein